ncbi:unnamed protein product [Heligmosomoides polygyrus]|uniref:Uncharacterized protein n=1 Tax=Heligmosomoides polygyrus TaxID=6339 RepID=A0A183FUI1_HELPZ|nr:unnamed protein product [Heligmosomoides polygyrus]
MIRDAVAWAKLSKIRWTGHDMPSQTAAGRDPSLNGFRGCQENTRTPMNVMVALLCESPSSEVDSLEHSGTRQGRMETLLAPAPAGR